MTNRTIPTSNMKLLLGVFACLTVCHAYAVDTTIDWSQVKHRDLKFPLPFGVEDYVFSERIVGGNEAEPNSIPYMAGLLIYTAEGAYFCGGSIISKRDILTAAHCLTGASQVLVVLGAHRITGLEDTQQRFYSTNFIIHEGWDSNLIINDVAIIKLEQEIQLNENVSIISLPGYSDVGLITNAIGVISGWGVSVQGSTSLSEFLKTLSVRVMNNWDCNGFFVGAIFASHFCTAGDDGVGACAGDAGGPFVIGNTQYGIISFALEYGCAGTWPTGYARLTTYVDWLDYHSDAEIN